MVGKSCVKLKMSDFFKHPVWEYQWAKYDKNGETIVSPAKSLPVEKLNNEHIIGVPVRLANGEEVWAELGNIQTDKPHKTEHICIIVFEKDGQKFRLERYFDPLYDTNGPEGLARFLGMDIDDVFPISYDVQSYVATSSRSHRGQFLKEPRERLPWSAIADLKD